MKKDYNIDIYKMYEETENKNKYLIDKYNKLKLDYDVLKSDFNNLKNKIDYEVNNATGPLIDKINSLEEKLDNANKEIERLKAELGKKDYSIDKLQCSVDKDSTNSGIPTSKEIKQKHPRTNTYNHRQPTSRKTGAQVGHVGRTLTKEKIVSIMRELNIRPKKVVHYIKGNSSKQDIIRYKVGLRNELYVVEHIFKYKENSNNVLPKDYYSSVTYDDDLKSLILMLGNNYSLSYNKVKEILYDFSKGVINISEGTIDNIYEEFANKSIDTINNITTNLLNGTYQHTDETTTKENGKDSYYRGYANEKNVLYKYHHHKGDSPIKGDNILPNFFGTIISDHEVGIFKYGTNNQDCIYHIGRYCIESNQNIFNTEWQMKLYNFLLRCDRTRKIAVQYNLDKFEEEDLKRLEQEYDEILENGKVENNNISSKYWKDKENALLNRLIKYKDCVLFYIHDFTIPADNNFMERALRMIKGKTKISGGFRSARGGERFGNIMSIIKTAKLRKLNPLICITKIFKGDALFA